MLTPLVEVDGEGIVAWFDSGQALKITGDEKSALAVKAFGEVPGLILVAQSIAAGKDTDPGTTVAACELVLEALAAQKRISRSDEIGWSALRPTRSDKRRGEVDD